MTEEPNVVLLEKWKSMKHYSVFEHGVITVKFICDRGVTHELVRHRLAAFSQESTRYCNYSKDKFGREITVIDPSEAFGWNEGMDQYIIWEQAMQDAQRAYFDLLDKGATPQQARDVLPNSLKTEIQMTANVREWRHVLTLRTDKAAHPQMRELMIPLLKDFAQRWPILFGDIGDQSVAAS
jgi:thymidylate synthase (FAD)